MKNIEFLEKVNEVLKTIKMKELVEYANKYIGENLEVGKKYQYSSYNKTEDIHYIINENIKKGLHELWGKYKIDYAEMFEFIKVGACNLQLDIDYKEVVIWENIGNYKFDMKKRKNASYDNKSFILGSIPKFELYSDLHDRVIVDYCSYDIENLSVYEFYIGMLEKNRQKAISRLEKEIIEFKRKIAENKLEVEKLEDIIF